MYVTVAYIKSVFSYVTSLSLSVTRMVVVYNLGIKYPLKIVQIDLERLRCNSVGVHFTPFRFRFTEGGTFRFNCVLSVVKRFFRFLFRSAGCFWASTTLNRSNLRELFNPDL